jgi:plastocyanin
MSKHLTLLLSAAALGLGVAACGGSSSTSTGASTGGSTGTSAGSTGTSASGTGTSAAGATGTSSSAAAAAGGSSGGLALAASPSGQLAFDKKALTAKAGTVSIKFTNMAPEDHNVTIQQGTSGAVVGATPTFKGGTKTLTVKLKAGTYTFFCSVPGHRMGGMQGTLTVS